MVDKKLKSIPTSKVNLVKETDEPTQTILHNVDFEDMVKIAGCSDRKSVAVIVMHGRMNKKQ